MNELHLLKTALGQFGKHELCLSETVMGLRTPEANVKLSKTERSGLCYQQFPIPGKSRAFVSEKNEIVESRKVESRTTSRTGKSGVRASTG